MLTSNIQMAEPFKSLFPIEQNVLADITKSMAEHGFFEANPIVLWKEGNCVLDGHTRLAAAIENDIPEIPVAYMHFDNEDDAVLYAVYSQRDRRDKSPALILRMVKELDKRIGNKERASLGGVAKNESVCLASEDAKQVSEPHRSRSAIETGRIVGISEAAVDRVRAILDHDDPVMIEAVATGEKSITGAAREIRTAKRAANAQSSEQTIHIPAGTAEKRARAEEKNRADYNKAVSLLRENARLIPFDRPNVTGKAIPGIIIAMDKCEAAIREIRKNLNK